MAIGKKVVVKVKVVGLSRLEETMQDLIDNGFSVTQVSEPFRTPAADKSRGDTTEPLSVFVVGYGSQHVS